MADPFEVRMRFTYHLQHLNASVNSSQKAAQYALKNRDMDEDLHSCILEQLERNSMNNRANIMYFIEHFCDLASRDTPPHLEFVRMMQRDILRVVDAVAPEDGSGAANVKVVRRVLAGLQQKNILVPETVQEIEACLGCRDVMPSHAGMSPVYATGGAAAATAATAAGGTAPLSGTTPSTSTITPRGGATAVGVRGVNGQVMARLDKRQIEQRIEEDRERHKRLRESIWAVGGEQDEEFERLWDEVSDVGEDDYLAAAEEGSGRRETAVAMAEAV